MVEPSYSIEADAPGKFLRLTLVGDWNPEIAVRYADEVGATVRRMMADGVRRGELRTLVDMRRKNVAPQSVVAEFEKMVRPDSPSKRIALLSSGALHRLQAKRVADDRCALFEAEDAALAWLLQD